MTAVVVLSYSFAGQLASYHRLLTAGAAGPVTGPHSAQKAFEFLSKSCAAFARSIVQDSLLAPVLVGLASALLL
tara:strand:- start:15887 stop:16108 length:222 start_codon:yes stop_codon:yes gene_type:complete